MNYQKQIRKRRRKHTTERENYLRYGRQSLPRPAAAPQSVAKHAPEVFLIIVALIFLAAIFSF